MDQKDKLRMKLATILSTDRFGLTETLRLLQLRETITEDRHFEFYQLISEKMRDELFELLDDEDIDHGYVLATALGNAAVLDWIEGDSKGLVTLLLDNSDTYAGLIASEAMKLCYDVAEHTPDPSSSKWEVSSMASPSQYSSRTEPRLTSVVDSTEQNVPDVK